MKRKFYLMVLMFVCTTLSVVAQVTTSSINGKVTGDGESIIGATVTAVHNPSGTRYMATTNEKGRYSIQGMRVGGPYTITISYLGFNDSKAEGVTLQLGEPFVYNANLKEDAMTLGEITVTGKAVNNGSGASTHFSTEQIENTPTVTRNIYDVAKLSPLVSTNKFGGITIAGSNNRYNSFQIDGMVSNDVFGLASSGTNGGQTGANPVSLDAIEQLQVVASPFDVRQSGFTGGAINAITKSGTNVFKGSAYTYYTDENFYSKYSPLQGTNSKLTDETDKTYGFTFGGPILKDKLFFFTSLEYRKKSYPGTYYPGFQYMKNGAMTDYFLTEAEAQEILDKYYGWTGHTDSYNKRNVETESWSLMARIDWNINNRNKLSFRYQMNDSFDDKWSSGQTSYTFNNSSYRMNNKTHSFVAELNSNISPKLYNELRVGATFVRDSRDCNNSGPTLYFPSAAEKITLGSEYSSGVNSLDQNNYTIEDNLSWYLGNHTFTFGTHNEIYDMKNAFIQAAYGEFVYGSIEDFLNDKVESWQWGYSDANITGTNKWKTPFKAGQFGFYAQDKWDATTQLQFNYGIRFDIPVYFNGPTQNSEFNESFWAKKYNVSVGSRPSSYVMVSPRLGFRWYADKQHKTLIRGGLGIFNGRAPFVWVENAWAKTGMEMKSTTVYNDNLADGTKITMAEYGKTDPAVIASKYEGSASKPDIVVINRNFRFPQVFRANLAWEQVLPYDMKFTLEGLYSKNINNVWFDNYALINTGNKAYAVPGVEASSVPYYTTNTGSYKSIINTRNTSKGYSYSISGRLEKSFNFGLDLMLSYTFGHSYSVNDGTSSVALSNWQNYYCTDPNKQTLSKSMFDIPHRILFNVNYNSPKYANGRLQTHVGLSLNAQSGQRYSLTMSDANSNSFNGDYAKGNSLLYIPTDAELEHMEFTTSRVNNVDLTPEKSRDEFRKWINNDKYAKNHRGQYAERNSNSAPFEKRIDLHVSEDFFYLKSRGSKVEFTCDIYNFANLLNKKWGENYGSAYNQNILQVTKTTTASDGNKIATFKYVGNEPTLSDIYSRWHIQLGLRVTF